MKTFSSSYDVIVCGGGPSGISAAVSAARQGVKVALIERFGILGGMMTSGYVNPILGAVEPGTIYDEIMSLLEATNLETRNGREMSVDTEKAKYKLLDFAAESGADIFLQTPVVDIIKEGSRLKGVIIGTQQGLANLQAKVIIDATGDGFIAACAGAEYFVGREDDGKCQPTSLEFTIDNVDESRAFTCWGGSDPVQMPDGRKYSDFCKELNLRGELPKNVSIVRIHRTNSSGERSINATQSNGYDTLTPEGVFGAELELRRQIGTVIDFLRKYIPGYEKCKLKATGSALGVRETRRILGDYLISDSDIEDGARKKDVVVHNAWFLIDIHNPAGEGQAEGHSQPAKPYDIPYSSLLPKGLDNIITCGRCISGTHRAHASYRVMAICMATGQAAGIAAALSVQMNVSPRELDVGTLQKALLNTGAVLFD